MVGTLAGCAKKVSLAGTPLVPAADGQLRISTDNNNNTKVKLTVAHLAPAAALSPPQSIYVVWTRTEDGSPQKQGILEVGDNRKGELEFVTPAQTFEVVVTAEPSPEVQFPSNLIALRSNINR
jgi:hypothetical protein